MRRMQYQFGHVSREPRCAGPDVWVFRFREQAEDGKIVRRKIQLGTVQDLPTQADAFRASERFRVELNSEYSEGERLLFRELIDRYVREDLPERYSTRVACISRLKNYIRPMWGEVPLGKIKVLAVEGWLKQLPLAPKTKAHLRSMMHRLFKSAMRWELIEIRENPMKLVEIKGVTKRGKRPFVLTMEQFRSLLELINEPCRTMVMVAQCLGLRISEILGLQWGDFNFGELTLLVQRGVVQGHIDQVKTEYSNDVVPLDPDLAMVLLRWKEKCPETVEGWVFPNSLTGRPFHSSELQKNYLKPAGHDIGLNVNIGWHTFRHTYRSWLDETGAPMKVQQELMRHASIQTTMNVYGAAMLQSKREANSKVVRLALKATIGR